MEDISENVPTNEQLQAPALQTPTQQRLAKQIFIDNRGLPFYQFDQHRRIAPGGSY